MLRRYTDVAQNQKEKAFTRKLALQKKLLTEVAEEIST
jgi:hypothetical protein